MLMGSRNLLNIWKREVDYLSSFLHPNRTLNRDDVNKVYNVLNAFFGIDYFNVSTSDEDEGENWLHFLLVNHGRPACILNLFEIANLIDYIPTLTPSVRSRLISVLDDPRQFRDLLFEVYFSAVLEHNGISPTVNVTERGKQVDVIFTYEGEEYLCECKKAYVYGKRRLGLTAFSLRKLVLQLQTMSHAMGLIGTVKFNNPEDTNLRNIFTAKLDRFLIDWNTNGFGSIDYHNEDGDGKLNIVNYDYATLLELQHKKGIDVIFTITPPENLIPNVPNEYRIGLEGKFEINQFHVTRKFLSILKDKQDQHASSLYKNKIYVIDNELIPDFNFPLFTSEAMFDRVKIQEYIDQNFSDTEILCVFRRNYMEVNPIIRVDVMGKNISPTLKKKLETLNTQFSYDFV